ncbi:dTDP-4-amino-4,6-dideoxygalactose transaminase [Vibrio furnissii]|uniref:dTDP-4-amino-4,6-dideoxygalactose transaminase n=1 Tax=Vibrio furnissii TaxID=29494 RepID=UPI0023DA2522|nr:dTDP-4-amino-4,6-dideoxygalactose transaminase [Vibrio furnissii]
MKVINFNEPAILGSEIGYISEVLNNKKLCGDGPFTKRCQKYFENRYGVKKALLTTSCTDALEMAAILLDIKEGDEVIAPSYTFVSTVNAFVLRGAKIMFADSEENSPNISVAEIERLISPRTRAIVVVHYAGMACDMDTIMTMAHRHNIPVVEDAAQAIESTYKGRQLGTIGDFGTFSFHETKNISCGEGGVLFVNNESYIQRAEIIREKGTNRASFFRGEVNKYGWVDKGSSFLPSELNAAFLWGQLENLDNIQAKRIALWERYYNNLNGKISNFMLANLLPEQSNNAHMFFIVAQTSEQRIKLLSHLKESGIFAVFHYLSLHKSEYYHSNYDGPQLQQADKYTDCLVRLPLFYALTLKQVDYICDTILGIEASFA